MKEQFRKWSFQKTLSVTYKDENGMNRVWEADQAELLADIVSIADAYMSKDMRLTNRQLYYQLVARDLIPNALKIYKRICKFLTDARYAGFLDWSAIEDRGRVPHRHSQWRDVSGLVESAVSSYRLPRWADQDLFVQMFCEKEAMKGILSPIADKYHIYFGSNKGYSSASTMYELAYRINRQIQHGKDAIILYLGDHDSSGLDMIRDIEDRVTEFLTKGLSPVEPRLTVKQLALTTQQVHDYSPPPNPTKTTDPRASAYISEHGDESWELDALDPETLTRIAEDGIRDHLDLKKYYTIIKQEEEEIKKLVDFADEL